MNRRETESHEFTHVTCLMLHGPNLRQVEIPRHPLGMEWETPQELQLQDVEYHHESC